MSGLVSIITRTLGRPCLADAAASVAAQTYRPLEWVVVDASGRGVDVPGAGDVPVRVASSGEPMLRARAANAGLDAAQGVRALILDDDDLLRPGCVERLAGALDASRGFRLAYGDVEVHGATPGTSYAFEYSPLMLLQRCLFPPNAALFDLDLARVSGARFDPDLNWHEDWDFWLQVAAHTPFLHVREVTADYRLSLSQSGAWNTDAPGADPRIREQGMKVIARYAGRRRELIARFVALMREAEVHERAGRLPEAASAWAAAHMHFHYDAEPVLRYAAIARLAGDHPAARVAITTALGLMPTEPRLLRALAAIQEHDGDVAGARLSLERAAAFAAAAPPRARPD